MKQPTMRLCPQAPPRNQVIPLSVKESHPVILQSRMHRLKAPPFVWSALKEDRRHEKEHLEAKTLKRGLVYQNSELLQEVLQAQALKPML